MMMNSNYFYHIIWYDDFVSDPQTEVDNFYDAFDIEKYHHNLNKVDQLKIVSVKYNDTTYGNNMHTIRKQSKS